MTSLLDVARHAHVGAGTVSRVINGSGYVSEATKEKVLKAIKELNYVPNELARNLLQNKSNTIALIVPDLKNRFFTNFVEEAELALRKEGYKTLLCNSFGKGSNEQEFLNMLDRNLVDGVITLSNLLSNSAYAKVKKPMVSFDSVLSSEVPMVYTDHQTGGRRAAEMLISAGCKNVIQFRDYVDLKLKNAPSEIPLTLNDFPYVMRHIAFEKTIKEAGIEYHDVPVLEGNEVQDQKNYIRRIYEQHPDVDGVMATDIMAIMYAQVAKEHGRRIPENLKIIAYDGTDLLDLFQPKFSTIVQPIKMIVQTCVDVLLRQIQGESMENYRYMIPVQVEDRF